MLHLYREADTFDAKLLTVGEALAQNGYDTAAVVANRVCEPEFGFAHGFEYYRSARLRGFNATSRLYWTGLGRWGRILWDLGGALTQGKKYFFDTETTPRVTEDAVSYITRRHRRPYFLWVHYFDPHAPYTPPGRFVAPAARPYARDFWDYNQNIPLARALWEGEARYVDENVGVLLSALAPHGRLEKTVVIITSDHGEEFGEHGGTSHGHTLYAELLHIPMVVVAPGLVPAATRCDALVGLLDIMPTALDLAGAAVPKYLPGRSLVGVARGEEPAARVMVGEALVTQRDARSIEADGWKLIWDRARGEGELYSLEEDPAEKAPQDKPFVTASLRMRLGQWEEDTARLRSSLGLGVPGRDERAAGAVRALGYVR